VHKICIHKGSQSVLFVPSVVYGPLLTHVNVIIYARGFYGETLVNMCYSFITSLDHYILLRTHYLKALYRRNKFIFICISINFHGKQRSSRLRNSDWNYCHPSCHVLRVQNANHRSQLSTRLSPDLTIQ